MLICPNCSHQMDDAPDLAGQLVACPRCACQFHLPGFAAQPAVVRHYHYHRGRDKASGMVAAALSLFVPGLGQLCQGRIAAAFLFFPLEVFGLIVGFFWLPAGMAICGLAAVSSAVEAAGH